MAHFQLLYGGTTQRAPKYLIFGGFNNQIFLEPVKWGRQIPGVLDLFVFLKNCFFFCGDISNWEMPFFNISWKEVELSVHITIWHFPGRTKPIIWLRNLLAKLASNCYGSKQVVQLLSYCWSFETFANFGQKVHVENGIMWGKSLRGREAMLHLVMFLKQRKSSKMLKFFNQMQIQ